MTPLPFTDRESYIAWRAEWRAAYSALSLELRECKLLRKWIARRNGHCARNGIYWFASTAPTLKTFMEPELATTCETVLAIESRYKYGQPPIPALKERATKMLEQRKQSKIQAQQQYLAHKALVPA
jgi:hypothetical protein